MHPAYKSNYPNDITTSEVYADGIRGAFETTFSASTIATAFGGVWIERERSRAPYTDAWELADAGITLFASQTLSHCCVEISGSGCERLIKLDAMREVLYAVCGQCSRIDIATDIVTDTLPSEFVAVVSHDRMRASGSQKSETGETCYVGSQKSDRFSRIYRYSPPHPRSHLLRVETVFRRENAKAVARACIDSGMGSIAREAGKAFGWAHPIWKPDMAQHADISIISPNRKGGQTIHWLISACAPAFKRLVKEGVIREPEAFIRQYFTNED